MNLETNTVGFVALILAIIIIVVGSLAMSHVLVHLVKDNAIKAFPQNP